MNRECGTRAQLTETAVKGEEDQEYASRFPRQDR
jgi:hypothetical protein